MKTLRSKVNLIMAAASVAWLSVTAKRGSCPRIVKCSWEETFADLLVKAPNELQTSSISTVKIAANDLLLKPQEVTLDALLALCDRFGCKHVCYLLKETITNEVSIEGVSRPNAFQVLMSTSKRTVLPPHIEHRSNSAAVRGDHAIYNKLLDVLERANLVHSYRAIY